MLIIRRERMEAMEAWTRERFVATLCRLLRDELPEKLAAVEEGTLRRRVEVAWQRAGQYGCISQRDIYRFIRQSMLWGRCFRRTHGSTVDPRMPHRAGVVRRR